MPKARLVAVGRVGRPHGVSGEVRLDAGAGLPRGLKGYTRFYLEPPERRGADSGEPTLVSLEGARSGGRFLILKFAGVETREAASALVHSTLYVARDEMPALASDEYYHADLLGSRVVDIEGRELGVVEDVLSTSAHDVMVIRSGRREWMLPIIDEYIVEMDVIGGTVRVRPPEGGP